MAHVDFAAGRAEACREIADELKLALRNLRKARDGVPLDNKSYGKCLDTIVGGLLELVKRLAEAEAKEVQATQ